MGKAVFYCDQLIPDDPELILLKPPLATSKKNSSHATSERHIHSYNYYDALYTLENDILYDMDIMIEGDGFEQQDKKDIEKLIEIKDIIEAKTFAYVIHRFTNIKPETPNGGKIQKKDEALDSKFFLKKHRARHS